MKKIKDFTFTTLVYFFLFGTIGGLFWFNHVFLPTDSTMKACSLGKCREIVKFSEPSKGLPNCERHIQKAMQFKKQSEYLICEKVGY